MKLSMVGLAFGLLVLAGCSTPGTEDSGSQTAGNERECRAVGGGTGSRMRQSVCRTAQEWALADAEAKEKEDIQAEFFRRVGENAAQTQAPAFSSPTGR